MFPHPGMSGEAVWRQTMELQSRKEVIERWLAETGIPAQQVDVLQEMLANTERQLQAIRSQAAENTSPSSRPETG